MGRFTLQFDAGGLCDLCYQGTAKNPMKKTIRLVEPDSCTIVLTICYLCVIQNFLETISKDAMLEKDLMKPFHIVREENRFKMIKESK